MNGIEKLAKKPIPQVEVSPVIEPVTIEEALHKVLVQPQTNVEALTTEYLDLWRKFEYFEVKDMLKRMDDLRKQLVTIANETMDAKKPAVFSLRGRRMEFSERGTTSGRAQPASAYSRVADEVRTRGDHRRSGHCHYTSAKIIQ